MNGEASYLMDYVEAPKDAMVESPRERFTTDAGHPERQQPSRLPEGVSPFSRGAVYGMTAAEVAPLIDQLAAMGWPELWDTLFRMATQAAGLETMTDLEYLYERVRELPKVDQRVLAAIIGTLWERSGRTINDLRDADLFARALLLLPDQDQLELLAHMRIKDDAAEGTIAMMLAAAVEDGLLEPPSMSMALTAARVGFEALEWNPGGIPGGLYVGQSAHLEIAAYYRGFHPYPLHLVATNTVPIASLAEDLAKLLKFTPGGLTPAGAALKPDIFDFSFEHPQIPPGYVYEIKPWSLAGLAEIEALTYVAALNAAHIPCLPGPTDVQGTFGEVPGPGGWFVFESPAPGVIAYQYLTAPRVRVPARVPVPARRSVRERVPTLGLRPHPAVAPKIMAAVLIATLAPLVVLALLESAVAVGGYALGSAILALAL